MAQRCDSELTLFYALQVRSLRADYEAIVSKAAREAYVVIGKQQRDEILSEAEKIALDMGMKKVSQLCIKGEPARSILQAANETKQSTNFYSLQNKVLRRLVELAIIMRLRTTFSKIETIVENEHS